MAIDAYSPCPGATGKKIKFCCPDSIGDLDKIERMIEGEQYAACLHHVEQLRELPANHDRQCLLAYHILLLRATHQFEAAEELAAYFLQKHPANQAALAESTLMAAPKNTQTAMNFLQRALAEAKGSLSWKTCEAAKILAQVYLNQGKWLPARALIQFLMIVEKNNQELTAAAIELFRSPEMPLLLKEDPQFSAIPENAPWKERFVKDFSATAYGDWCNPEKELTKLAAENVSEAAVIWRALATLRGWLGDIPGCITALEKFVAFDVPQEDAVEAQAVAMLLSEKPLDDSISVIKATWTVSDPERLQESLLSEPRLKPINYDLAQLATEDSPPPKAIFMVFDRPAVESTDELSIQSMPRLYGQISLFGRQTDSEARLEMFGVTEFDFPKVKEIIVALAGDCISGTETTEVLANVSATEDSLQTHWLPSQRYHPNQLHSITNEYRRDVLLNRWPDTKLGVLAGKTPRQAASDPALQIKLQAAILVLQHYCDQLRLSFDLNELRTKIGLPVLEPIDPKGVTLALLPLARLARLSVEKLTDIDLLQVFQRAVGYNHRPAIMKFAGEIINRPSFAGRQEQMLAYMSLANNENDLDRALQYIQAGRKVAEATGNPHASWDLEELSLRFARQDITEALELIRHIDTVHGKDPHVKMLLTQMLINVGLLNPDGTMAYHPGAHGAEMAGAAEMPAQADPGKLWTPDGETSGGGGKLWVPE